MCSKAAALLALALALAGPAAGPAAAQPLSAIDWLSESVALPPPPALTGEPEVRSALPEPVTTAPLDRPAADSVGLLPARETGLPATLWSASQAEDVARKIASLPDDLPPTMRRLLKMLLLAEAEAPQGGDGSAFLARVDKLLDLGMLAEAEALLLKAGVETPEQFRRWFDVTLLIGAEDRACASLRARPEIAPTYPARIFCLARGGDWNAAALTLETAEALDLLTPEEDALLAGFLDAGLVDELTMPVPPQRPTPLEFRIFEAIGEPIPTARLPIAFAHADLRHHVGWKTRLEAGERLARAGAIEPERLLALYAERTPAASGGLWDRVAAMQALIDAVAAARPEPIAEALPPAWDAAREAGLEAPFARAFAAALPEGLDGPAGEIAERLRLIGGARGARPAEAERLLETVGARADPALVAAIASGLAGGPVPDRLQTLLDAGRVGEATLGAIDLFAAGVEGDLRALAGALAFFRKVGLSDIAEQAAAELLLTKAVR